MLAEQHRLRTSAEFRRTTRSGARSGGRNVVVYACPRTDEGPSRFGFIVSRAVGNAVVRNKVRRRLRALAATSLGDLGNGMDVAVRALPGAGGLSWDELGSEYLRALGQARHRSSSTRGDSA